MKVSPFRLERFFDRFEFGVPYLLSSSDCESLSIRDILSFDPPSQERFLNHWLGYTESRGNPELRQEIARLYNGVEAHEILVHAGAEEAIFTFMYAALEPGDHVIVHTPCYQSLLELPLSLGCEVTSWPTCQEDNWELDIAFLRTHIKSNTRAIIINCPHNPTGYLLSREAQAEIIEIARSQQCWLFSDEVYRGLEYDPSYRLPAACELYEKAISLGVMSKIYGLAGLRIGWIATRDHALYQRIAQSKDYTTICNSAPSEFLALTALRHGEQIVERNKALILSNLQLLRTFLEGNRAIFSWYEPHVGPIMFPELHIPQDIEAFCVEAAQKQGVMLLPGTVFTEGGKHVRLGYGRKNFPEALARFADYLQHIGLNQ
ncbi:aminotransferase class I/II-fold pyridoxal phosphate-dependent enzyme [Ktedonosporobacter rubrisoli]|uniref:Aminotransferase class I/II-fold pyridoxal phosphate-dependent enzyme n=1 Tax=Ktedonosporobacter rubrisoli TaxID=2509675 RepID=A0A4P6JQ25_KTERU|nr:aminotransferase class I/II-fold pyridoxal phosphate-dependent enzyme [Ktedonosporobacter rubrisoli]QBD77508.1 aminotransferase class I/II-fold pyridoxal phosphate-dependent enzyme [Ktedonosporobacter rubrisoli]